MKHAFLLTSALCVGLVITGCASTATGKKTSLISLKSPAEKLEVKAPKGSVLTVIRYPSVVETAAHNAYIDAYLASPIGGRVSKALAGSPDAATIADGVIVKSNYFALSLYKELVKRLPEHSVLLSPHTIKLDKNGQLISEPITKAENLGAATYIDFVSYSFPDPKEMMGGKPLTFGDLITPMVVVRSDHRAAPASQGVLMASGPLMAVAGGQGRTAVHQSITAIENGDIKADKTELAFISYLANRPTSKLAVTKLGNGQEVNAAQYYPMEKILLDRNALASMQSKAKDNIDPLENAFSSAFADRIVAMLNDTDVDKAVMMGRAASVSDFDPSLAALSVAKSNQSDQLARLRYAERLLEAEKKYLSVQSLRIYDGIYNGEMGAQVRDMLQAEYKVLNQRRKLARQQNVATALTVLAVVAAGASISNQSGPVSYSDILLNEALVNAAMFAGTQAFSFKRRSAAVGKNYLASIVPAIEEQTSVQVNLIEGNETITAIRFEDLQAKLHSLYTKNQRALDIAATQCKFAPNITQAGNKSGKWLGECKNGTASGAGMGVIREANGMVKEYYGQAKDGMAHGIGFMIYHTPEFSYSLEGNFVSGQPEGIMRVKKPGQPDQLRAYKNGQDIGAAPKGSKVASPFDIAMLGNGLISQTMPQTMPQTKPRTKPHTIKAGG